MDAKINKAIFLIFLIPFVLVASVSGRSKPSSEEDGVSNVIWLKQFSEKWQNLIPSGNNDDYIANLKVLKELTCGRSFIKLEVEFCILFKGLEESPQCSGNGSESSGSIENFDRLRREIDLALQKEWMSAETEYFAVDQFKRYAEFYAQQCAKQVYEDYKASGDHAADSNEFELVSIFEDCTEPKHGNENLKRADVSSLACYAELLRRTTSNAIAKRKALSKMAKLMRKFGAGLIKSEQYNAGRFYAAVSSQCFKYKNAQATRSALFYRSIILRDEYFDSVPQDDTYFDRVKLALVCRAIGDNYGEIIDSIGTFKISLLGHF